MEGRVKCIVAVLCAVCSDNFLIILYHKSAKNNACALKTSFKLLSHLELSLDPVANEAFYEHMRE